MLRNPEPPPRRRPRNRLISEDEIRYAITGSTSVFEAAARIGVKNSSVYKALRRYHIQNPEIWNKLWIQRVGKLRKLNLQSIVSGAMNRLYVGTLIGTEGTITCGYDRPVNSTRLKIQVGMTDLPWVAKFARVCGVGRPLRLLPKYGRHKDVYVSQLSGLRALLVLKDVLPYLRGGKLKEAKRALEFFSPTGYIKGRYFAMDIWDPAVYHWKDNRHPLQRDAPT